MKIKIRTKNDIDMFFKSEDFNSEIFGDENESIAAAMLSLLNDANKYGCEFEADIPTFWGSTIHVVASPFYKKHYWSFS